MISQWISVIPTSKQFVKMKHRSYEGDRALMYPLKISDSFMEAVENNETFTLQFPVDADEPEYTVQTLMLSSLVGILSLSRQRRRQSPGSSCGITLQRTCRPMPILTLRPRLPTPAEKFHLSVL